MDKGTINGRPADDEIQAVLPGLNFGMFWIEGDAEQSYAAAQSPVDLFGHEIAAFTLVFIVQRFKLGAQMLPARITAGYLERKFYDTP